MTRNQNDKTSTRFALLKRLTLTKKKKKRVYPAIDDYEGHYIARRNQQLTPRYKITRLLGKGSYGKVVECYDRMSKTHCAVKIIRSKSAYTSASKQEIKILQFIKARDPTNQNHCIQLLDWFKVNRHVCLVFDVVGQSLFDYIKSNNFQPFTIPLIQAITRQLLVSISFLHSIHLIHTDLKPENILLVNTGSHADIRIQLIDFGSSVFESGDHPSTITTQHYRAPEVLLGLPWSYPCDVWSLGCLLVELFTGEILFPTQQDTNHLAMMETILGEIPQSLLQKQNEFEKYPNKNPSQKSLKRMISKDILFYDLISKMLTYEPKRRLTAQAALLHPSLSTTLQLP